MMRKINAIIIHHSASKQTTTVEEIRSWHKQRGFADIGYHWVIRRGNKIWECVPGRHESVVGAHCAGHNAHTIGVVVCGDYRTDSLCDEAKTLIKSVVEVISHRHNLADGCVAVHSDFADTECPGNNLREFVRDVFGTWPKGKAPDC